MSLSKLEDFTTTFTVLYLNNFVACVAGAKRGGGGGGRGRKARKLSLPNPPPFFPSSLSPTPVWCLLCRLTTLVISWCCTWVSSINFVLQRLKRLRAIPKPVYNTWPTMVSATLNTHNFANWVVSLGDGRKETAFSLWFLISTSKASQQLKGMCWKEYYADIIVILNNHFIDVVFSL